MTENGIDSPEDDYKEIEVAYEIVEEIEQDLDELDLEKDHISLDIDLESSNPVVELEYNAETLEWYEKGIKDAEHHEFNGRYRINSKNGLCATQDTIKDTIKDMLTGNFDSSPIRLNGEVIQESLSPDYDAF